MEYTRLGSTGTTVSQLCFGTWRFGRETGGVVETDREEAHELLDAAWERGINFIDTANVYGNPNGTSEEYIGEWLDDYDREDFVIASKVYFPFDGRGEPGPNDSGLGRKHIRAQIEGTLDRLDTDYLDLYYIHRWDEHSDIEETLSTLDDLIRAGKVHHLGASTMAAWQLTKALWKSDVEDYERFEVTQPLFHAGYRDDVKDYLDVCVDQDIAVCPYSPLAGGFLTGKYERTDDDDPTAFEGPARSRLAVRPFRGLLPLGARLARPRRTPRRRGRTRRHPRPGRAPLAHRTAGYHLRPHRRGPHRRPARRERRRGRHLAVRRPVQPDRECRYAEDGERWGHRA